VDRGPNIRLRTSLRPLAAYACCGHLKYVRTREAARRLKAQILKRWDAEHRAQAPLDLMEPVQVAVALVAAMVLFAMSLPSLMRVLALLRG
jgi:hypothetical protein